MKKNFLFFALLTLTINLANAQYANPGFGFAQLDWVNKDYLTLTSDGSISTNAKQVEYIMSLVKGRTPNASTHYRKIGNYYSYSIFNYPENVSGIVGAAIVEIDGVDAKYMTVERATELLCEEGSHRLKLRNKANGVFETTVFDTPSPIWVQAYGFDPRESDWKEDDVKKDDDVVVRIDHEAPWSSFKTYDYDITSDDVLEEKELLEKVCAKLDMCGLRRDTEKPDIIVTIAKDARSSIEYTYVPESSQTVVDGSRSRANYDYKGRYTGTDTRYHTRTVTSGGYTHKQTTSSFYFEIDILEASRLGQKQLPLIEQVKYEYVSGRGEDFDALYQRVINRFNLPIAELAQRYSANGIDRYLYEVPDSGRVYPLVEFGIVVDDSRVVRGVDSNSDVVRKSGLKVGDKIVRMEVKRGRTSMYDFRELWQFSGSIFVENSDNKIKELKFRDCKRTFKCTSPFFQYR